MVLSVAAIFGSEALEHAGEGLSGSPLQCSLLNWQVVVIDGAKDSLQPRRGDKALGQKAGISTEITKIQLIGVLIVMDICKVAIRDHLRSLWEVLRRCS